MTTPSHALVTPSFRGDIERCRLLVESVDRWVTPGVPHYLVVDRRDVELFQPMVSARTKLVVVEEILPWWIMRVPGISRFWLSLKTVPIRNWMLQQVVKLSMGGVVTEDVLLFVDSDVFFIAPFDPASQVRDGLVPLFVQTGQRGLLSFNDRWHGVAARLLGLPVRTGYDTNFIGNVIIWRRDSLQRMLAHIGKNARRHWLPVVAGQLVLSEYIVYGLYATEVEGIEAAGHYAHAVEYTRCYWDPVPMTPEMLGQFRSSLEPHHYSVMISAKSRTPIEDIRATFLPAKAS
ncbi:MAG: DUF6492 family protein [Pseudomonadota bacterium]